jgi:hypothetical protein
MVSAGCGDPCQNLVRFENRNGSGFFDGRAAMADQEHPTRGQGFFYGHRLMAGIDMVGNFHQEWMDRKRSKSGADEWSAPARTHEDPV